jgi:hypothetical protein
LLGFLFHHESASVISLIWTVVRSNEAGLMNEFQLVLKLCTVFNLSAQLTAWPVLKKFDCKAASPCR